MNMNIAKLVQILLLALGLAIYAEWAKATRQETDSTTDSIKEIHTDGIRLIDRNQARALWSKTSTLFLDVRSRGEFAFGHIPGALHCPEEDYERNLARWRTRLERARNIVVYCQSKNCAASLWLAIRLCDSKFKQVDIYPGGWNEWYLRGYPTTIRAE